MRFQILGPLQVAADERDADSALIELGPPKQRAVLGLLVLHAGEVVPAERLVDRLWAGRAPRTAAHSVQVYVSDLRRRLREVGCDPIETRGGGYLLRAAPQDVDALEFQQLTTEGQHALRAGRPDQAAAALAAGLALWRGSVLADVPLEDVAQERVEALNGLRLDAMEALADALVRTGDGREAVPTLLQAITTDALRERSRALLMVALYQAGRHAEALRSFTSYTQLLADELGVDPSPELRQLYERVLLHDATLLGRRASTTSGRARNPYKGLRPFSEEDVEDFFGREALTDRVLDELDAGVRLVTLVGPSGSGKSSALAAGVLPVVRALPRGWDPVHVSLDEDGVRMLEDRAEVSGGPEILLVLDQLEELFLQPDADLTRRFLTALAVCIGAADPLVLAVATLRADFYDRPLEHRALADVFLAGVVNVLPPSAHELELAAVRPAAQVGVALEPGLVAELVADAVDRPGALPLLQYALTELFDRRAGSVMSAATYRDLGRLAGALRRRAEHLFTTLGPHEQDVAMQLLLRLVRVVPGERESRRRVLVADLTASSLDPVDLSTVLHLFVEHRLLSVDRDTRTGGGTVELAHESLLWEWDRYAAWVERHRSLLLDREALLRAVEEWESSGRHPDYLLRGRRLERFTGAGGERRLGVTVRERELLDASQDRHRAEIDAAAEEVSTLRRRRRRERGRWAAVAAAAVVAAMIVLAVLWPGEPEAPRVALLFHDGGTEVDRSLRSGFDRGSADFHLVPTLAWAGPEEATEELRRLSGTDQDVIIVATIQTDVDSVAGDHPEVEYVVVDQVSELPNVTSLVSLDEEGAYLAGAAAALTTRTGTVGFVGGVAGDLIARFEAGYVAGARAVDPEIEVLVEYISRPPDYDGFVDVAGGERVAGGMYRAGADVVFAAAGQSGLGVFEAAAALSGAELGHLWAIGVDGDQYETVRWLPGVVDPGRWQRHILTSVTKAIDKNVYDVLADVSEDRLEAGRREVGLAAGAVGISWSGGHLEPVRPRLERLRQAVISGEVSVPHVPAATPP